MSLILLLPYSFGLRSKSHGTVLIVADLSCILDRSRVSRQKVKQEIIVRQYLNKMHYYAKNNHRPGWNGIGRRLCKHTFGFGKMVLSFWVSTSHPNSSYISPDKVSTKYISVSRPATALAGMA